MGKEWGKGCACARGHRVRTGPLKCRVRVLPQPGRFEASERPGGSLVAYALGLFHDVEQLFGGGVVAVSQQGL
jgi:hypothetical protein